VQPTTEFKFLPPGSQPPPCKLHSRKCTDLVRQTWHVNPLQCPACQKQIQVVGFTDHLDEAEKILRHMNLWCGPAAFAPARSPPSMAPESIEPDFRIEYDTMPLCEAPHKDINVKRSKMWSKYSFPIDSQEF